MAYSFTELHKAVVHAIILVSFLFGDHGVVVLASSIFPLTGEDKRLVQASWGRGWLWGKLGLALVDMAMLSKFLILFSADGWDYVPSLICFLAWVSPVLKSSVSTVGLQLYGRANGEFLQENLCQQAAPPRTATASAPDPVSGHCQPTPLQETPKHSQADLAQSLVGKDILFIKLCWKNWAAVGAL